MGKTHHVLLLYLIKNIPTLSHYSWTKKKKKKKKKKSKNLSFIINLL